MRILDVMKLVNYILEHKDKIYCVYAGIEEDWENTSDEIYFHEMGFLSGNLACTSSRFYHPIAYIHYFDDVDEENLISEFRDYEVYR